MEEMEEKRKEFVELEEEEEEESKRLFEQELDYCSDLL